MPCKADVRKAIYDSVLQDLTEGRYTFSRLDDNTIQINGRVDNSKTKAKSTNQARAIAQEVLNRVKTEYSNHVVGYISQASVYDPVTITFKASDAYVEHEYNKIPIENRTDKVSYNADIEQDDINANIGPNMRSELGNTLFMSPTIQSITDPTVGYFTKYIQLKKDLLSNNEEKLNEVEKERKSPKITTQRLQELNKQRTKLKLEIEGNSVTGKVGLKEEILKLEKSANTVAVAYYVKKDLERLTNLSKSDSIADLTDAQRLINFYTSAGTFEHNDNNPFFLASDIYLPDAVTGKIDMNSPLLLSNDTITQFKNWADYANSFSEQIKNKIQEVTTNAVNSNIAVQKTFKNKSFTFGEITNEETGLKDTDYASMWIMDITQGIWSHNGLIPQIIFSELNNLINDHLAKARLVEEKTNELNPKVIKRLKELNHTLKRMGVIDKDTHIYEIFKEKTKDGHETGNFIMKFNKEFYDKQSNAINSFFTSTTNAQLITDPDIKRDVFRDAFQKLRDWRRKNTIVISLGSIPEIINNSEFSEFTHNFNTNPSTHKDELVKLLGQKEYDRQIAEQTKKLREYSADRQSFIDVLMDRENITDIKRLSAAAWNELTIWEKKNSPFFGVEDYHQVIYNSHIDNNGKYNVYVPRRYEVHEGKDASGKNVVFTDYKNNTGYYNETYEKHIESDPILSEFHDLLLASNEVIRAELTYQQQKKFQSNSLPAMLKSSSELLLDRTSNTNILRRLFESFSDMWEKIRLSMGVDQQGDISYNTKNPITGKSNYKVNDNFIANNDRALRERQLIERTKFLQAFNTTANPKLDNINRFTVRNINRFNADSLLLLADYLGVKLSVADAQSGNISAITDITGQNVEIGRIIRDFSMHSIVQSYSFDLAKLIKNGTYVAAMYGARSKALPILEVMKKHYENIKNPKTNNILKQFFNIKESKLETDGERENAKKQIEDWFDRVALGNYGLKHSTIYGKETGSDKIHLFDKRIFSKEDREKYKELTKLISNEIGQKKREELISVRNNLGKVRTVTAAADNLMAWVRTLRLGYNLSSGITNFIEGFASNMILASTGEYFNPNEIYYGYHVTKLSTLKSLSFGKIEHSLAKKNRILMDKFRVLMDTANELQKNSIKSLTEKLDWLHPHSVNSRVEFNNQSPVMIAMLRTLKITGINGETNSVWNAYTSEGNLKTEFRTPENIENWEELTGDDYKNFKEKLSKVIVLGHGNYDTMRGMMAKSNTIGKASMMFKSWIPQQFYWRFAQEQTDLQTGNSFKGKYRSYTITSGAFHGGITGAAIFGPLGAIIGATAGGTLAGIYGAKTEVSVVKELVTTTRVLVSKMIGMPINVIVGKGIIKTGDNSFDKWIGGKFTQQDANALKSNMADLGTQLLWLALMIMTKAVFWDDKDKPDDPERLAHNILVNRLMQLASQAGMYVNLPETFKSTIGSNAVIQYLTDVGKEVSAFENWIEGRDIVQSGQNAGESSLWNQTKKIAMPGIFRSIQTVGLDLQMQRQFQKSPYDNMFRSKEFKDMQANKRDRASKRNELEKQYTINQFEGDTNEDKEKAMKKYIEKILNDELPTPTRLKKLGETREEYNMEQQDMPQ